MSSETEILKVLAVSPQPLGWYGISIRLGALGSVPDKNLVEILRELEQLGLVRHEKLEGHPHGAYLLTDEGYKLVCPQ